MHGTWGGSPRASCSCCRRRDSRSRSLDLCRLRPPAARSRPVLRHQAGRCGHRAHAVHRIGARALTNRALGGRRGPFIALFVLSVPFPAMSRALRSLASRRQARAGAFPDRREPSRRQTLIAHGAHRRRQCDAARDVPLDAAGVAVVTGLMLWALPIGSRRGDCWSRHTLTPMGWFFTKAALLTFGGAYAVLPYVYHGAVIDHGWLLRRR